MLQVKRGCDDLTEESSSKSKRTCNAGGDTHDALISGGIYPDSTSKEQIHSFNDSEAVWTELREEVASNLAKSVVSLFLLDGNTVLFACSGITMGRRLDFTRILTSSSLARAFNDKRQGHNRLKIKVCHEGNDAKGILREYDLDQEIALVYVRSAPLDVHPVDLNHPTEFQPQSKVVALGHDISGKLIATGGTLTSDSSTREDSKELMLSTCKISEAWEGGPLFDYDGNFVGMNLPLGRKQPFFLPRSIITERLEQLLRKGDSFDRLDKYGCGGNFVGRVVERQKASYYSCSRDALGYPQPSASMISDGMVLVNTFEETFGEVYGSGKGIWSELSETSSSYLSQVIVSLASFKGDARLFVCTGFAIDWNGCITILTSASLVRDPDNENKIDESLMIQVLLPDRQHREGILRHCNLHKNVALLTVKDFCPLRLDNICKDSRPWRHTLYPLARYPPYGVALGRCFESGMLMATGGSLVNWSGLLDSGELLYSTCRITKAGIGGPLVDFHGRFIGMNFYDEMGTPFMPRDSIIQVLENFEKKRAIDEVCHNGKPARWPVPVACWRRPGDDRSKFKDWDKGIHHDGYKFNWKVGYIDGELFDYH